MCYPALLNYHKFVTRSVRLDMQKRRTATAESTKALTGLVTVNNANKIATRLVSESKTVNKSESWKVNVYFPRFRFIYRNVDGLLTFELGF